MAGQSASQSIPRSSRFNLIGILLAAVAVLLGRETGALLVGERTNCSRIRRMRQIITRDPAVERVGELLTMQMGPQEAILTVEIRFHRTLDIKKSKPQSDESRVISAIENRGMEKIFIDPVQFPKSRDEAA
jgi:divalent metal cation (Fe/Co/Zn/Cd) transporter